MQRQAILLLSLLLVAPEKAPCQQDMNSESLMDQAQNAVAQRTEQLTDEYAKELERLAKVYEQSGDLVAKAAANTELTRVQQTRQIAVFNFNQLPLGVAALEADYTRRIKEETIRILHPLVAQRRDEIAERKQKRDFATAMIMEKELNAVCARFGWETKNITLDNAHVLRHPTPKYPLGKERTPDRRRIIFSRNRHHQRRGNARNRFKKHWSCDFGSGRDLCTSTVALC